MSDHSFIPKANPKIVPPAIPAPRKESFEEENARLKAEVERLRKAGDAVALDYAERIEIEAGETAKTLMKTLPVLRDWNAAKEGKPSETKSPSFIEDLGNGVEKHDLLFRYPAKEGKHP